MIVPAINALSSYVPDWVIGIAILAIATIFALAAFEIARALLRRFLERKHPLLRALLERAAGLFRFALVLFAAAFVAPILPFSDNATEGLHHILIAAFVILVGWITIVASNLAADRYMRRFQINTEDNLLARKAVTQMRVLKRTAGVVIGFLTLGFALMTFDAVREYGVSIFASAGVAGIALGLAAKPLLGNLIAGIQIAITQPIRIEDVVIVQGEFGWIEEFTSTYVIVRLWDWRRMVVPLGYFLENPFQNWTRSSAALIGSVYFHLDHRTPVSVLREKLEEIVKASKLWDGKVVSLQVTDTTERTIEVRALASARNASQTWDLRCEVREKMLAFLQEEHPRSLPRVRAEMEGFEIPDRRRAETGARPVPQGH
ncbi:MAG TPA: mechanosensitive ion channel domain-containing protein [Rhizomicrobium sp.]|nr:mechanosensitive ion channel domain-containing protein [Rhizomicrobium sp.]